VKDNNNNHQPWGKEGDFAVHASVYGKVQAEDNVNPDNQERKGKKKKKIVVALTGLASYQCSLCAICQSVQARGVVSTPPHYILLIFVSAAPAMPVPRRTATTETQQTGKGVKLV
jgi:hypothetical protein